MPLQAKSLISEVNEPWRPSDDHSRTLVLPHQNQIAEHSRLVVHLTAEYRTLQEAAPTLLESVCRAFKFEIGELWCVDEEVRALRWAGLWHEEGFDTSEMEAMSRNTVLPSGAGMPGRVWSSGQITRVTLAEEPGTLRPSIAAALGLQQAVAFPIRGKETTLGVVTLFSCGEKGIDDGSDLDALQLIGGEIGRLYEAKRAEDALNEEERLAKLREEIAKAVTGGGSLQLALQESADAVSRHLDAIHVRIWTFRANLNLLELQAYGGIAPDAEVPDSQIPLGSTRIGIVAQQRRPFISNSVAAESSLCDPKWVHKNGIVSFAGYPLIVGELLVGVLALFFRQPPRRSVSRAIPSVVDAIALGIRGKGAEAALRQNEEFLQRIIDSTHDGILVMNVNGRLQYVSPGGQSLMEMGDNSIADLNWSDLWKGPQSQ